MLRFSLIILAAVSLTACSARAPYGTPAQTGIGANPYGAYPLRQQRQRQLGQYIRPDYLNPQPTPRIPETDFCQSQLYQGLVGKSEGAIYIAGLPGRKRVLKPAFTEDFEVEAIAGFIEETSLVEVKDYLPQQVLYAPSIRTVTDRIQLGPVEQDRLTLELDREGYVQEVRCG